MEIELSMLSLEPETSGRRSRSEVPGLDPSDPVPGRPVVIHRIGQVSLLLTHIAGNHAALVDDPDGNVVLLTSDQAAQVATNHSWATNPRLEAACGTCEHRTKGTDRIICGSTSGSVPMPQ